MSADPLLAAAAVADDALDALAQLLRGKVAAVLTGAGVSTDSGIPDYRGTGSPVRTPMTFQTFVGDERARKRYWACLLYTSPSPRDRQKSRMPSSA